MAPIDDQPSQGEGGEQRTGRTGRRLIAGGTAAIAVLGLSWIAVSGVTAGEDDAAPVTRSSPAGSEPAAAPSTRGADPQAQATAGPSSAAAPTTGPLPTTVPVPSPEDAPTAEVTGAPTGGAAEEGTRGLSPVELEQDADGAVESFAAAFEALPAAGADDAAFAALEDVATGPALAELQSQVDEVTANQWSFAGEAAVSDVRVLTDPLEAGPADVLRVMACVDSSAVVLRDQDGAVIQDAGPPGTRRSLNIYDLELRDGAWIVVDHSFPDTADC